MPDQVEVPDQVAVPDEARVPSQVRVTDEERDQVVARLKDAIGKGALEFEEVEQRLDAVYKARTQSELAALTADLPAPAPEPAKQSNLAGFRSASFQMHLVIYLLVNAFLIGIWAVAGGGEFWPFFPIGGWGIGLAMHYIAATAAVNHRERKRVRRELGGGERGRDRGRHRHSAHGHELGEAARQLSEQAIGAAAKQLKEQARRLAEQARQGPPHHGPHTHLPPPPRGTRSGRRPSAGGRQRRFVVAMFVDIADSTRLNEAMGDQLWAAERDRFRRVASECFKAEKGWEVSAAGDGILARFDEPAAAVRAAVELQRKLASLRETQFAPSVRIGIHSGDVIDEGDDIVGSVINIASRVNGAGEPDDILITEHVADHIDGNIETIGRGLHTLKGVSRPRHLLAIKW